MRVLVLTHGTRGDVQPFATFAAALQAAGHQVTLAAPAASVSTAELGGARLVALDDGPNRLIADPEIRRAIESNYRGLRGKRLALRAMRQSRELMVPVLEGLSDAAAGGADVVVHHIGLPGHYVAEKLGVPSVVVAQQPGVPTGSFPSPMFARATWLPKTLNRASYLPLQLGLRALARLGDTWRKQTLGLPRRAGQHNILRRPDGGPVTVIHGFSRHILPAPLDYPDWVHTTGFWYQADQPDWTPPPRLAEFVADSPAPVSIGFGSMVGADPRRIGHVVVEAVRLAGVRAVVVAGWGGIDLEQLPDDLLLVNQVPYQWLFPRTAAVVHHGGSGTTALALAAGRPQVVCPFATDQPFFAARMHAIGVAPPALPQRRLTAERLAEAIHHAATSQEMSQRAATLARQVRAEEGVAGGIKVLESL